MIRKFRHILLLILSVSFLAFAVLLMDVVEVNLQPLYSYENTETNHGVYKERYLTGGVKLYEEYANGLKDGVKIEFRQNEDTISYYHFKNGKRDGIARFFASDGVAVLEEVYLGGYLLKKNILNDSLYTYDFKRLETGHKVYKTACMECHTSNREFEELEQIELSFEALDSVHLCVLDSVFTEESMTNYMAVNLSELSALDDYMNSLKKSEEHRFNKSLVVRNKKKRLVSN